jgi:subtilisin family serine protease
LRVIERQSLAHPGGFDDHQRNGDSGLKPDVTAPGVGIFSTGLGTGYGAAQNTGTSMATAFVSGIAALVREARPGWRATQVKAAIINNALPLGDPRRTTSAGSGLVLPRLAVSSEVVAMGQRTGGGLSFGLAESTGPVVDTKTITLTNRSDRAATYALRPEWFSDIAQPTMTFSPDTVTVPPRGQATVDVTLRVEPRLVPGGDNPGVLARQPAMVAGNVVLTTGQEGELGLRVPFSSVVRGISTISTTPRSARVADQITFTSTNADGVLGPIDVFAWGLSDPRGDALGTDVRNVGFQSRPDLGLGIFAIHTDNTESNPSVNESNVMLNTDGDEEPDYAVVGRDSGAVLLGGLSGNNLVAVTVDLETGQTVRAFEFAFTQLNSGIVLLPVQLADVGLAAGAQEEFSYTAGVVSQEVGRGEDLVDGAARFNAFRPPVQTGQFNVAVPGAPSQWTATVDRAQLAETPVKGWLAVYRFNRGGAAQAQPIALR